MPKSIEDLRKARSRWMKNYYLTHPDQYQKHKENMRGYRRRRRESSPEYAVKEKLDRKRYYTNKKSKKEMIDARS